MTGELVHGFLDGAGCPAGGPYCWGYLAGEHATSLAFGFTILGALLLGFLLGRMGKV